MKLLLTTCCLASCLFSCSIPKGSVSKNFAEKPDTSLVIHSDSIDRIINRAKTVILYDMCNLVMEDSTEVKRDSLLCFAIEQKIGKVKDEKLEVLRFILKDYKLYIKGYSPIRQPFCPNFALEFKSGKEAAFYFVSFNTDEVAIADATGDFMFYRLRDSESLARWVKEYFPENSFYDNLTKSEDR